MSTDIARLFDSEKLRLDECVKEPIRTPDSIQPHGALLALDTATGVVVQASDNCGSILGVASSRLLGRVLADVMDADWLDEVSRALSGPDSARNPVPVNVDGQRFDAILHRTGSTTVLEFEPSIVATEYESAPSVYGAIHELTKATTEAGVWACAARELRALTLFDRVMVYHFHPDGHGEVVAEEVAEGMEPYLGLHYPASDIPAQARELYVTKLSRMIVDSSAEPSALLDVGTETSALDLSQAELRSVSPYHLQFMRNMGQASTLSLSIVRDDQLIGMITMASRTPRRVPYVLRRGLEVLASQVAAQLGGMTEIRRLSEQMRAGSIRAQLVNQIALPTSALAPDLSGALFRGEVTVLDLIPSAGAMMRLGAETATVGTTPPVDSVVDAVRLATARANGTFIADALPLDHPHLSALLPDVAGLLVVPLPGDGNFLAWFRPEITRNVTWLGDQTSSNRDTPLSPRQSFSSWTQSVADQSAPWDGIEVHGEELARDLAGALLRLAEAQLAALALYDVLTGLPNRRLLMDRLDHALANHARGTSVNLLFIDLDSFKGVNDTLGHDAGDAVLIHAARQIRAAIRTQDTVARLGGDEFVVLCENTTTDEAEVIAGRIVDAVRQPAYPAGTVVVVTASVGLVAAQFTSTAAGLLKEADAAMYRAKARGRDQVCQ